MYEELTMEEQKKLKARKGTQKESEKQRAANKIGDKKTIQKKSEPDNVLTWVSRLIVYLAKKAQAPPKLDHINDRKQQHIKRPQQNQTRH